MKLWIASDYTHGAWYDMGEVNLMAHGRAEAGETLNYYQDNKTIQVVS